MTTSKSQPVWYKMIEEILDAPLVLREDHLNFVKLLRHKAAMSESWEPTPKQREALSAIWDVTFEE